jgi:hypothetical protein
VPLANRARTDGAFDGSLGEHGVDAVRDAGDQPAEEVCRHASRGALMRLGEGEPAGAVDGDAHAKLALLGPHVGTIDVEEADRIGLERLLRLRSRDVRQPADGMPLEQSVQR